jgi:hypothetical protein
MAITSQTFPGALTGTTTAGEPRHPVARATTALVTLRCRLLGHDPDLRVDASRMYLSCPSCGIESPGWVLDRREPRQRFSGAPDRFERYAWMMGR